jgi:putative FmdB family regulatory protein
MEHAFMFYEAERLAMEERLEVQMPTETFTCSKCGHFIRFTAKQDEIVLVKCPECGHMVEVVIESRKTAA